MADQTKADHDPAVIVDIWRLRAERAEHELEKLRGNWHDRDMEIRTANMRLHSENTRLRRLLGQWLSFKLIGVGGDDSLVLRTREALNRGTHE
jgi:hypothetical protein